MPTHRFTPEELRELHDLAARWAQLVSQRAFGESGPGLDVDFRTFEPIATAAAQGLTEGTLQLLLEQQAGKLSGDQPCPQCGKLCPTGPHARSLTAQGATVQQVERIAHCPACRRDFPPPRGRLWGSMSTPSVPPSPRALDSPRSAMPPVRSRWQGSG